MGETVGAYLLSKATNMHNWLNNELDTQLSGAYLSELTVTSLANKLASERAVVAARDWDGLSRLARALGELEHRLEAVRSRCDLHDKFWRYLELFVDVVSEN